MLPRIESNMLLSLNVGQFYEYILLTRSVKKKSQQADLPIRNGYLLHIQEERDGIWDIQAWTTSTTCVYRTQNVSYEINFWSTSYTTTHNIIILYNMLSAFSSCLTRYNTYTVLCLMLIQNCRIKAQVTINISSTYIMGLTHGIKDSAVWLYVVVVTSREKLAG